MISHIRINDVVTIFLTSAIETYITDLFKLFMSAILNDRHSWSEFRYFNEDLSEFLRYYAATSPYNVRKI